MSPVMNGRFHRIEVIEFIQGVRIILIRFAFCRIEQNCTVLFDMPERNRERQLIGRIKRISVIKRICAEHRISSCK